MSCNRDVVARAERRSYALLNQPGGFSSSRFAVCFFPFRISPAPTAPPERARGAWPQAGADAPAPGTGIWGTVAPSFFAPVRVLVGSGRQGVR